MVSASTLLCASNAFLRLVMSCNCFFKSSFCCWSVGTGVCMGGEGGEGKGEGREIQSRLGVLVEFVDRRYY